MNDPCFHKYSRPKAGARQAREDKNGNLDGIFWLSMLECHQSIHCGNYDFPHQPNIMSFYTVYPYH
jgi:hypothetical protein